MATHKPSLFPYVTEFLAALLAEQEPVARAGIIAAQAVSLCPGCGVAVYRLGSDGREWSLLASSGGIHAEPLVRAESGTLADVARRRSTMIFGGESVRREDYAHLGVRRTVASLAYVPLVHRGEMLGTFELVSFDRPLREADLAPLDEIAEFSALALAGALAYETERNSHYDSITRLTQLYDLERTFNSTLEMNKLLPIVTAKVRDILNAQAVNLWMVHEEDLLLASQSGDDPTTRAGDVQRAGEGIAAEVSDSGKSLRVVSAADPRLVKRGGPDAPVNTVMAVPIVAQGFQVGVLEAVNRADGQPFGEDDIFFIDTIAQTAASALHNASLLEAERKIEILETLVEVSREITSTLNLERVLQVVVNGPQKIMSYERGAIALESRGRLRIKAISGKAEVVLADPAVRLLQDRLEVAALADREMYITQRGGEVDAESEDLRTQFAEYFRQTGMRAWYSQPLEDDQGRLGVLSFESKNPEFLSEAHLELIKVLAAQATVALRNASLYTEVPFINVLEPLLQKKRRFMRMESRRRRAVIAAAAAVGLFLVFCPLPMRVAGGATVAPQRRADVQAGVEGVVRRVLVREGEQVKAGAVLAEMDDWQLRSALGAAEAKYNEAAALMNRALSVNDGATAGMQRVQADFWQSEVGRARERLERTRLRSPIDGTVATPRIEDLAGRKLEAGEHFAEVLDTARASIDVTVEQQDLPLLRPGESVGIKLDGFPTRKFRGTVGVVSPLGVAEGDRRVFMARVDVPNRDGVIRAGMQGQGKVSVGWRPAGYVMFRDLGLWSWTKLWNWFGW